MRFAADLLAELDAGEVGERRAGVFVELHRLADEDQRAAALDPVPEDAPRGGVGGGDAGGDEDLVAVEAAFGELLLEDRVDGHVRADGERERGFALEGVAAQAGPLGEARRGT